MKRKRKEKKRKEKKNSVGYILFEEELHGGAEYGDAVVNYDEHVPKVPELETLGGRQAYGVVALEELGCQLVQTMACD